MNEEQNAIPQTEQLQIVKVATPEHTGLISEFHVIITDASVPGMTVSASCHAQNIAVEECLILKKVDTFRNTKLSTLWI